MQTTLLIGAEEVSRAASNMRGAAEEMQRAANNIDYALQQHQRFLDDWLNRLEQLFRHNALPDAPLGTQNEPHKGL